MKTTPLFLIAVLTLGGCAKSADAQFRAMCADQKANDPAIYASSADACGFANSLTDDQKMLMVNGYDEIKRARARLGTEASK